MMRNGNRLLLLLAILIGLAGSASTTNLLAQDEVEIVDAAATQAFGQELRFSLQAQNAADVQALTLLFRPELSTNQYMLPVSFEPGEAISLTKSVDVRGIDIRPFGDVTYSWVFETPAGRQESEPQRMTYEDDRFPWQTMTRDSLTAHWTGGGGPAFGQGILDIADEALARLEEAVPVTMDAPVDIYVYPSSADLRSAMLLAGADDADNVLDLGVILVTSVNEQTAVAELSQSIPYELANLHLLRATGDQYASIPWWLREGLATNARLTENPRQEALLDEALQAGQTIPMWRLCQPPQETGDRAELARIQAAEMVDFLNGRQAGASSRLLVAYRDGHDCAAGVQSVFDLTLDEVERAWLESMQAPTFVERLLSDVGAWLILFAGGTLLIYVLFRILSTKGSTN